MDIVTVQERGMAGEHDPALLASALGEERVMLTNDSDFLALAAILAIRQERFAPIFFWPQRGRRIGETVRAILREARTRDYAAACSRVFYL